MSITYPGLIHCRRCGQEHESPFVVFLTRGKDPKAHHYCPNEQCLGHTIGRSLYWVAIESA